MIRTTMAHKKGSNPGNLPHGRIVGHPSSQRVIKGSPSLKSAQKDGFAYRKGDCIDFNGSPKEQYVD